MSNKLVLVDGSSYLFRAYHGLPPLTSSKGEPTGAIYGVVNMLQKLSAQFPSSHFAVIFDPKGRTSRYGIYPEYKANRSEAPEDLIQQIAPLHAIIQAMGFPLVVVDGFEADDVIGTLTKQAEALGWEVVISTGDKDIAQLVNDQVSLVNTMTGKTLDVAGVLEKFGVRPNQIIDYLALMGDSSDNIPGVPKVGPKTAVKWLGQYDSLDKIMKHAGEFKGKVGEHLRASLGTLPLSKQLVTLELNVAMPYCVEDLVLGDEDTSSLKRWFQRFEFKKWLHDLDHRHGNDTQAHQHQSQYQAVTDEASWLAWCDRANQASVIAVDTETTGLNAMTADLVGVSLSISAHEAVYVPLKHHDEGLSQLSWDVIAPSLQSWFDNQGKCIVGQNLKYDLTILSRHGVHLSTKCFDTMLASYILNPLDGHSLDNMALRHLGVSTISFEEVAGKGKQQVTFDHVPLEVAMPYAAEDADIALQLYVILSKSLSQLPVLEKLFWDLEMPTMRVIQQMEQMGVYINDQKLRQQSARLGKLLENIQEEAWKEADQSFNLSSPKQLRAILYEQLQLPVTKKTASGEPSTDEEALAGLSLQHALPRCVLKYRTLSKLKSTYTDKLPELVNAETGRIHTSYNQAVTSTGRFSSTQPNLQNIPIKTEEGRKIREAFIAAQGKKLLIADYSQVELRIMAHMSEDATLIEAFKAGLDIHKSTAAEIFSIPEDRVTTEQRRHAKAVNFGLIYGMSAFGLARELGVNRGVASEYIKRYFTRYPGVKNYMEKIRILASEQGFVETLWGRRLYVPDIHSRQMFRRKAAERAAINAPLQGTSADILKGAMVHLAPKLKSFDADLIMQVHDELVLEVAIAQVPEVEVLLREVMENAAELLVPLSVDIRSDSHW